MNLHENSCSNEAKNGKIDLFKGQFLMHPD
jgi:hypothetical protein